MADKKSKQKDFLKIAKEFAIKKGGVCLSENYVSIRVPLKWKCKEGHEWEAPLRRIRERGSWCPICMKNEKKKNLLEKLKPILEKKEWKIIEGNVENYKERTLTIKCSKGHKWKNSPQGIIYNGCPECSNHCKDKEKHMEKIREIIEERKGTLISGYYENLESTFVIRCEREHIFETKAAYLKQKKWCRKCANLDKEIQLEKIKEIAFNRGGKCISEQYINKDTKLSFVCVNNHEFEMTPHNVKQGQWCPKCSWYFMENKARYVLEKLLNKKFNPNGKIISPYVLDGYSQINDKLKIAFEYHGRQHYEFIEFFHKNIEGFEKRKIDDAIKMELCLKKDIKLIIIPHYEAVTDEMLLKTIQEKLEIIGVKTPKLDDLKLFFKDFYDSCPRMKRLKKIAKDRGGIIMSESYNGRKEDITVKCGKGHVWTTKAVNLFDGKWCKVCANQDKEVNFQKLKNYIKQKEGKLITEYYENNKQKVEILCKKGHLFKKSVHNIINSGQWCPKCAKTCRDKEYLYNELKKIVESYGGTLLTSNYTLSRDKVRIKCKDGHIFEKIVNNIKSHKQWCPYCNDTVRDKTWLYNNLSRRVREKGGTLITKEYTRANTKMEILCDRNHLFKRTPYEIKRKNLWCQICQKKKKRTIKKS